MPHFLLQLILATFGSLNLKTEATLDDERFAYQEPITVQEISAVNYVSKEDLLSSSDESLYWVVAVLDGDTILVSGADRELFQVRLLAVDTNEINGPDSTAECYGIEASLFTSQFLQNRAVRLYADPANQDTDPYGRKLRYVDALQKDGSFLSLNSALLIGGYATFPSQYPVSDPEKFKAFEASAKNQGVGLWGVCSDVNQETPYNVFASTASHSLQADEARVF